MILVDSSGWIEYLAERPKAAAFARYIEGREALIASAVQVFELYRVIRRDLSEERAIESVAALQRARIVEVDTSLALEAAELTFEFRLAMADALIYATARRHSATLVTGDADFDGLPSAVVVR